MKEQRFRRMEEGILKNCDELAAMISGFKKKLKAEN